MLDNNKPLVETAKEKRSWIRGYLGEQYVGFLHKDMYNWRFMKSIYTSWFSTVAWVLANMFGTLYLCLQGTQHFCLWLWRSLLQDFDDALTKKKLWKISNRFSNLYAWKILAYIRLILESWSTLPHHTNFQMGKSIQEWTR